MGLDMYAFATSDDTEGKQTDIHNNTKNGEQLAYWRKFNALHGWMQALYDRKGGQNPEFNCNTVVLNLADLNLLETDLREGNLSPTEGFFFDAQEITSGDIASTYIFIARARAAIAEGKTVFYDSWWQPLDSHTLCI